MKITLNSGFTAQFVRGTTHQACSFRFKKEQNRTEQLVCASILLMNDLCRMLDNSGFSCPNTASLEKPKNNQYVIPLIIMTTAKSETR